MANPGILELVRDHPDLLVWHLSPLAKEQILGGVGLPAEPAFAGYSPASSAEWLPVAREDTEDVVERQATLRWHCTGTGQQELIQSLWVTTELLGDQQIFFCTDLLPWPLTLGVSGQVLYVTVTVTVLRLTGDDVQDLVDAEALAVLASGGRPMPKFKGKERAALRNALRALKAIDRHDTKQDHLGRLSRQTGVKVLDAAVTITPATTLALCSTRLKDRLTALLLL